MMISAFNLTNAIGALGFLFSLIGYCLIRRISAGPQTPSRLYCNARICFLIGLLKMSIGIFEITWFNSTGGTWWGWVLILFSIFWIVRGNKFRRQAANISAGYQSFNENNFDQQQQQQQQQQDNIDNNNNNINQQQQRRLSHAPQIVIVSDNNPSIIDPNISSIHRHHGGSAANQLSQPIMEQNYDDQALIKNAVPPSPFIGTQGNDSYIVPSIPMAITITPRSGTTTPRCQRTVGNVATYNDDDDDNDDNIDIDTQPHAEDSVYIDDDNEDDGKNEMEPETPKGAPERKTSEGNVTFS